MGAIRNMRAIRPKNIIVILENFHGVVVYSSVTHDDLWSEIGYTTKDLKNISGHPQNLILPSNVWHFGVDLPIIMTIDYIIFLNNSVTHDSGWMCLKYK